MNSADFTRAIEHARRQVEKYKRVSLIDPMYKGQLKSARIVLVSLMLIREWEHEKIVISHVNKLLEELNKEKEAPNEGT